MKAFVLVERSLIWEMYEVERRTGKSITQLANEALMQHLGMNWLEGRNFDLLYAPYKKPSERSGMLIRTRRLIIEQDFFYRMYSIECDTGEKISVQATKAIRNYLTRYQVKEGAI